MYVYIYIYMYVYVYIYICPYMPMGIWSFWIQARALTLCPRRLRFRRNGSCWFLLFADEPADKWALHASASIFYDAHCLMKSKNDDKRHFGCAPQTNFASSTRGTTLAWQIWERVMRFDARKKAKNPPVLWWKQNGTSSTRTCTAEHLSCRYKKTKSYNAEYTLYVVDYTYIYIIVYIINGM